MDTITMLHGEDMLREENRILSDQLYRATALLKRSVIREWVMGLPRREQGLLMTAIRGCDLAPKNKDNEENNKGQPPERALVAYLRWLVMVPADEREVDIPGAFMRKQAPHPDSWKPSMFEHYPMHWYTHLMHAFEVVGYRHPDIRVKGNAQAIYKRMVEALHLHPETAQEMAERLSRDRFAAKTVVS
jgi:hypothetical protein